MTYLAISLPFLVLGVLLLIVRARATRGYLVSSAVVMAVLLVLTIIFDNLMVWAGLVGYGDAQQLGIQIGLIPIEDLFYAVFAGLVVPALWLPWRAPRVEAGPK